VAVFWFVASYSLVEVYRRYRGAYCFYHQGVVGRKHLRNVDELLPVSTCNNLEDRHIVRRFVR
jgi:hypothetical protein